ncbi:MAG TPA: hypothetical protein VN696_01650 [Pyrinomonadaceae bacterium]|nr:hypothetical protein [Pyrinomonadaceae bacterium]
MPGWLKALLIVLAIIVVLVIGVIAVGGFLIYRNKDAIVGKAKAIATEAKNFGENTDNQGCVDEAISRYKAEPGIGKAISTSIFVRVCLDASKPTPGFCDNVPKQHEFFKAAQWKIEQCRRVNLSTDSNCQNLFTPVQQFCEEGSFKRSVNNNSNSQ